MSSLEHRAGALGSIRVAYFGPEGTFTHEALLDALAPADGNAIELVPLATIYETVMAVESGAADRALVPIENSLEGSVNATLDALAMEAKDVRIVGEVVHPIRHCLVTRTALRLDEIEAVVSHPQATAQCAGFIRNYLPRARVMAGGSTADAVRMVAAHDGPWAALGTRSAAERYGCRILRSGVEDDPGNETLFVWLARGDEGAGAGAASTGDWKTSIVFWGAGSDAPGWLVRCLSEFADRGVNLTRIESRPLKQGLGSYMFFLDLEGRESDGDVGAALDGLRTHVEVLRTLGSFPGA
ncbi:MAG TPA: prephenate dehydratase [Solirubrobacteraceae bacterium]|nr:prephenate dehydratase [Solirubrobacteraceae bacterium]